ncbi:MAG TPA: FtsX-like permease family protein [Cyclobacteriaceae bacterium]|nr:FtsX-like permease family protein [Cyclobacteriaceae bacterium]
MLKSYFKIGWRNLRGNKVYSVINIGGLAIGMTVAMFIGLWISDELSFNKYHTNYDRIAIVRHGGIDPQSGEYFGGPAMQFPVGATLKNNYSHLFETIVQAWWPGDYMISNGGDKKFSKKGIFLEGTGLEMFTFKMVKGSYNSLDRHNSVVISESMAMTLFGDEDPMNKAIRIDNRMDAEVTGVFEDIPRNNMLGDLQFVAPWSLFYANNTWLHGLDTDWGSHMTNVYVLIKENTTTDAVNDAMHNLFRVNAPADFHAGIDKYKTYAEIYPMSLWYLFSEFENGKPVGGRITFVWLFGIVGAFVLLLACINFVNLSTARSEKRAREVGVRKAVGSAKQQLVAQFLSESFMVVVIAFGVSLILLALLQPAFNELADKKISLPFTSPLFWAIAGGFILFTGLLAGMYPAFYLSSFQPARVLKGALRLGRFGTLPRKVLVVVQFTVSVILVIGTLVVYNQVQYAHDRPVGYSRDGLIFMPIPDPAMRLRINTLRNELLATGVLASVATSSTPLTETWSTTSGYLWEGKDPNLDGEFANVNVTYEFGEAIGWKVVAGRDFSRDFASDSTESIIVNEAAVRYMGLKDPIGQKFTDIDGEGNVKWSRTIIGVVKDIVVASPYEPVMQSIYYMGDNSVNVLHARIDPSVSAAIALPKIKEAFAKVNPGAEFDYRFVDEVFATKFSQEERIGMLTAVFSVLAIFISCLGLLGLASFVAEQRTKEIGIRKIMGASISNLWRMLSKDFVVLVIIACCIATPVGYLLMTQWLKGFEYRTDISWWIVLSICAAAVAITLLTVSYQSIKAAMMNPVKSLRTE